MVAFDRWLWICSFDKYPVWDWTTLATYFFPSTIFVKKPERVEALLFIMTLALTVYAAIEYKIRLKLKENDTTIPNQIGKQVKNPSARWVFQSFNGIHVLYGKEKTVILNLKNTNAKIIELLGENYRKYYFLI